LVFQIIYYFCTPYKREIKPAKSERMYAIVEIAGQQHKVVKDQVIFVHRLEGEEGSTVELNNVMLLDNEGAITIGQPNVTGAVVTAKILSHLRGDKVIVFKKKRRKGYQKSNGHRQYLTRLQIDAITA
jgi:large subunit ribosomal protein L21